MKKKNVDVVPHGVHRGKELKDLEDSTIHAMASGWNSCDLRFDPFYSRILAERDRRDGVNKQERKTLRDEIAMSVAAEVFALFTENLDLSRTSIDWLSIAGECYAAADSFLKIRTEGGA